MQTIKPRVFIYTQHLVPERDKLKVHGTYASLYVRYVNLVNKLGDIFDQTLQVQKRNVVQTLLMAATQRMLELQKELKSIEMSEFVYIDQTLIEDKLIPQDIQLLCPFYYPAKRTQNTQDIIDGVRKEEEKEEIVVPVITRPSQPGTNRKSIAFRERVRTEPKLTPQQKAIAEQKRPWEEAMTLIVKHEKAR